MESATTPAAPPNDAAAAFDALAPAPKSSRAEGGTAAAAQRKTPAAAETPSQNPDSGRCSFWLPLKRRFCKAHVHKGSRFCGAHLNSDAEFVAAPGERRVPCPLNPNHSVAEKQLKRHLEVCADRGNVATDLPYHRPNINGEPSDTTRTNQSGADASGDVGAQAEVLRMDRRSASAQSHRSLGEAQLAALVALIDELHAGFVHGRMASLVRDNPTATATTVGIDRRAPAVAPAVRGAGEEEDAVGDGGDGGGGGLPERRNGPTPFAVRHSTQLDALVDAMAAVGVAPPASRDRRPQLRPGAASDVPMVLPQSHRDDDWPALAGAAGDDRSACAFVELAAGKGAFALVLSDRWAAYQRGRLAEGLPPGSAKRVVVVDRGGFRRKADGRVSKLPPFGGDGAAPAETEAAALQRAFLRLRIDLRDLALNCVPELQYTRQPEAGAEAGAGAARTLCVPATVFGKHLCGACTDFALSCAVNAEAGEPRMGVPCICIATCCHHLAERRHLAAVHLGWGGGDAAATAVAKASRATHDALLDRMGEHGFDLVASIASWAVSEGGHAPPPPAEDGTVTQAAPSARTITGRKAKQLVDWLRVLYLRGRGFHAELIDGFVGADVSPENAVILAWQEAA